MPLCISSASIHVPFVSFWLLSQVCGHLVSLNFSSLLPHFIIFSLSSLSSSCVSSPFVRLLLQIRQYSQRAAEASRAFNLPNKLTASFSTVTQEEHIVLYFFFFGWFWICVSGVTLKRFPGLYLEAAVHLTYWFISWIFTHRVCRFCLEHILTCRQFPLWLVPSVALCVCVRDCVHNCQELSALKFIMLCGVWREQ